MNIADVTRGERCFTVTWDAQSEAKSPFIWLRDNDPDDLHPDTCERVSDLPIEDPYDFYAAYRRLMLRIRDERYAVRQLAA